MTKSEPDTRYQVRPVVYDYRSPHKFLYDLMTHYRETSNFSVRQRVRPIPGCSPALVSQVLTGKRRLTRDQLPAFAKLFKLYPFEFEFIDKNLRIDLWTQGPLQESDEGPRKRTPKNHILNSWINVYVKDLVNLKGFTLETKVLHKMLFGMSTPKAIEKSVSFLLKQGFWRRTPSNKIVAEDAAVVSTNEIPDEKIREFHKQALKVALRGLDVFPSDRRKASTVLVSVDKAKIAELRSLIDAFQNQLLKFVEDNPEGSDDLIQVVIHMTPVGGNNG